MPATNYSFSIEQSSDFNISFQYLDSNGAGVDLTNACVKLRFLSNNGTAGIFTNGSSSDTKPSLFNNYGYDLSTDSNGFIYLKLSTKLTSTYTFNTAVYDLDVEFLDTINGQSRIRNIRIATGTINIIQKNFPNYSNGCDPSLIDYAGITPTPTPTPTGTTPTPTPSGEVTDLCFPECGGLDIFSIVYSSTGGQINIPDCIMPNISPGHVISTISGIYDPRPIENIEVAIVGLNHESPQDLYMELDTPFGSYTLSAFNKISHYSSNFNYIFSNKAPYGTYVNTVYNGGYCMPYDALRVDSGFVAPSGNWSLNIYDNDILGSGYINMWKLIVTYTDN
jgi:subtilisin-like proprotein convertase family protein